jgi:hypothetical protein|tara:strand:+ start:1981 stop:2238 length:258 start_codon:yes stop_codon:yes gene_type:complete
MKNLTKLKDLFLIIFLYFIILGSSSHAYFDPGTGAFVLQAIITFFAAVVFYLGYPIRYIKQLYKKIFKKEEIEAKKDFDQNNKSE